ncbi:hypothetical protein [Pedobacter antarcticus]|uniref:Class IIb bacteriocin, lactobin A/cerein 7B family n=2 Tax=Pedobacter antarcticus TaxID=34086 RepID=A0A081PHV4_9SPHI|nr:hypothetical protein [Pedobacter antarcticus]KEQ30277.1 hypothetical protein N180_10005 [Pedobacter antarcticus 4BY]SDL53755.1 class IIb bacteriocin, lactobin A/cerein 7B family [Pedobacter antarcticus]SFE31612.1 class IIb bacteriocin, lactobin A/cerein 7B family [Pedobacter antarcticus]
MENLQLATLNVEELDSDNLMNTDGGFIPLVIWGVSFTAAQVAGGAGAVFLAGMGIGAAVAAQ